MKVFNGSCGSGMRFINLSKLLAKTINVLLLGTLGQVPFRSLGQLTSGHVFDQYFLFLNGLLTNHSPCFCAERRAQMPKTSFPKCKLNLLTHLRGRHVHARSQSRWLIPIQLVSGHSPCNSLEQTCLSVRPHCVGGCLQHWKGRSRHGERQNLKKQSPVNMNQAKAPAMRDRGIKSRRLRVSHQVWFSKNSSCRSDLKSVS
jgi:hypothetical protein